ncbi:type II toxin-antitoxin system RelE/ParE family toxin [Duganella sp. FT27W]|uniref:type II toxin-antitoxin system RelE/ParE family toxin n=1 Tax=Duganella sp. FT27W TaxID=2654636 RepID=UPI00128D2D59|nr:type II toxin-antitoxin system RelE/ParE family toxin [Duganella sp. FT27W]MPQ57544.1 type II toxin-antitoxin system RelE/ParE family toxin [Duganella sp. FT27W]
MSGDIHKRTAKQTATYRCWFNAMLDRVAKSIVASRVERLQMGLYGDVKSCGEGVSEIRIDFGPGYRVYYTEALDNTILLLLMGGDKSTQKRDIKDAKKMLADMKQLLAEKKRKT